MNPRHIHIPGWKWYWHWTQTVKYWFSEYEESFSCPKRNQLKVFGTRVNFTEWLDSPIVNQYKILAKNLCNSWWH